MNSYYITAEAHGFHLNARVTAESPDSALSTLREALADAQHQSVLCLNIESPSIEYVSIGLQPDISLTVDDSEPV